MSEILSPAQRARLAEMERERIAKLTGPRPPDHIEAISKRLGAVGCLLMLALMLAGCAGIVALIWRAVWR